MKYLLSIYIILSLVLFCFIFCEIKESYFDVEMYEGIQTQRTLKPDTIYKGNDIVALKRTEEADITSEESDTTISKRTEQLDTVCRGNDIMIVKQRLEPGKKYFISLENKVIEKSRYEIKLLGVVLGYIFISILFAIMYIRKISKKSHNQKN